MNPYFSLTKYLAVAALIGALVWVVDDNQRLKRDKAALSQSRDEAVFTLRNQQLSMSIINDIAQATQHEKNQNTQQMDRIRHDVREQLRTEPAASVLVVTPVAERVFEAANRIRAAALDQNKPGTAR
jgi:hypothetical protein